MRWTAAFVAALSVTVVLAGCASKNDTSSAGVLPVNGLVPVEQRHLQSFQTQADPACVATKDKPCDPAFYSHVLVPGPFKVLAGKGFDIPVNLPATTGAPAVVPNQSSMHLGLFLPAIPGCDWTAASLPDKCKIPAIAEAGPYYASSKGLSQLQDGSLVAGEGDTNTETPAHRLGAFLIENLVPYGYAVAQVSVFGTGDSGSCEDMMGTSEQLGLDAVTTWLGTQPWSSGKVGYTGRSYDGSTPWEAAMTGNPHLATIVPISGLTSLFDLMYHNGTAETRGAGELDAIYAADTIDGDVPNDGVQVACPDYLLGGPEGVKATVTGDPSTVDPYWSIRVFWSQALKNYKGSIYLIHGLQDWNVDPHMAFPVYDQFEKNGNEVKALLGQWFHNYPDRPSEHVLQGTGRGKEAFPYSVRYDWAQDMLEWFNHTLKGGPKPMLHVEVQDNLGNWRIEPTWPPAGVGRDLLVGGSMQAGGEQTVIDPNDTLHFDLGVLDSGNETRFSGLPHYEQWVTPTGPGGQIYAELVDEDHADMHLGHAILDLRFANGGHQAQPVVPGQPMKVRLEFEPLDVLVPKGHRIGLLLSATGEDYVGPTMAQPILLDFGEGQGGKVMLTTIHPAASQFFTPPTWSGVAEAGPAQP